MFIVLGLLVVPSPVAIRGLGSNRSSTVFDVGRTATERRNPACCHFGHRVGKLPMFRGLGCRICSDRACSIPHVLWDQVRKDVFDVVFHRSDFGSGSGFDPGAVHGGWE